MRTEVMGDGNRLCCCHLADCTIDFLPSKGQLYKACLHTHTIVSDGNFSPKEIKRRYKALGYSVVAFTDHELLHRHDELADDTFLPLAGLEIALWSHKYDPKNPNEPIDRVHLNFLATRPDVIAQPWLDARQCARYAKRDNGILAGWKPTSDELAAARREAHVGEHPDMSRYFDAETVRSLVREAKMAGFLVALNHPRWSHLSLADANTFEGLWAVEVYNRDSEQSAYGEDDFFYEALLRGGRNPGLRCLATDDAHFDDHIGHGWVNVRAECLDYGSIIEALRAGHFYSSTGPEILEARLAGDVLHVRTSPCVFVRLIWDGWSMDLIPQDISPNLTSVEWGLASIRGCSDGTIRLVAEDSRGGMAWTNAVEYRL